MDNSQINLKFRFPSPSLQALYLGELPHPLSLLHNPEAMILLLACSPNKRTAQLSLLFLICSTPSLVFPPPASCLGLSISLLEYSPGHLAGFVASLPAPLQLVLRWYTRVRVLTHKSDNVSSLGKPLHGFPLPSR